MLPAMWLEDVRRTLASRSLLPPRAHVLVALSGGPDSAGLLLALSRLAPELGLTLRAATVDHGLRESSKDDVAVAEAQANAVGAPIEVVRLSLPKGADLQARARAARYEALFSVARSHHCDRVAVGHTKDDQAETILSRIFRGASIRGLRGIHAARGDGIVRPLIDVSRAEVHAAVAESGWPVARDPSNELRDFQRVRIRKAIFPAILDESPRVVDHLADLADDAAQALELIEAMASGVLAAARVEDEPRFRTEPLRRAPTAVRREALAIAAHDVTQKRPNRPQLLELELLLRGKGEVLLGGGVRARFEPTLGGAALPHVHFDRPEPSGGTAHPIDVPEAGSAPTASEGPASGAPPEENAKNPLFRGDKEG